VEILSVAVAFLLPLLVDPSPAWQSLTGSIEGVGFDHQRAGMIGAWLAASALAAAIAALTQRTWLGVLCGTWMVVAGYEFRWATHLTANPPILFGFPEQLSRRALTLNLGTGACTAVVASFVAAAAGRALSRLVTGSVGVAAVGLLMRRAISKRLVAVNALCLIALAGAGVVASRGVDSLVRYGPDHLAYRPALARGALGLGQVSYHSFFSQAMGSERHFAIYLPPGYSPSGGHRYPVLFLLHGDPGTYTDWLNLGLESMLDSGIAQGAIPPVIAVMPDGNGKLTFATQWADRLGGADPIESSVLELRRLIDHEYLTLADPGHRLVGGLSSGAFGAANLAARHPDVFGTAISLSGYFTAEGPVFGGDQAYMAANSPKDLVRTKSAARAVDYLLVVGKGDGLYLQATQNFAAELSQLGVRHDLILLPGGHQPSVWSSGLMLSLEQVKPRVWPAR
jgi:enterochelin esterase-like enzyme